MKEKEKEDEEEETSWTGGRTCKEGGNDSNLPSHRSLGVDVTISDCCDSDHQTVHPSVEVVVVADDVRLQVLNHGCIEDDHDDDNQDHVIYKALHFVFNIMDVFTHL